MKRELFESEHHQFRSTVREFLAREVLPQHAAWEQVGIVDRGIYASAARQGVLGFNIPEAFGGGGAQDDFRYNVVANEEASRAAATGPFFSLQSDVLAPYLVDLTNDEQKRRWLPDLARGELVAAVAMTEPGAGSDLLGIRTKAVPHGDHYVLTGSKTFISSGIHADIVVVAARTGEGSRGLTLLVVERDMAGFTRGRNLDKLGLHAQDTAELHFDDVRVPRGNLLGLEGQGFELLLRNLPQERLSIAVSAVAAARGVLTSTLDYVRERRAFGQPIGTFQHSRFLMAELDTELDIAQSHLDRCTLALNAGDLTDVEAAKAKWWCTELQQKVVNSCLQLHGGYGYMTEYPVARAFTDARIQTIYGGTTEVMKEIIGRSLGLGDPQR